MSTKKGISVRFTNEELSRLEELSERYDVPMTTIIRWSIQALDDYTTNTGGRLTLPIDFREILRNQRAAILAENNITYSTESPESDSSDSSDS